MHAFEYANPSTVQEAVALLGANWMQAGVLAGGTDLISLMKEGVMQPRRVVNIKNIKELEGIELNANGGGLRIGAIVTIDDLAKHAAVPAALADAARGVPSPQIRHMGTVGGDLCRRPQCWYYRQGFGLLGMKDGQSLIPEGENKYHAIFPSGPAYFVSASSLGPALVALGARVKLVSPKGPRELPVAQFFRAPKDEASREIALQPNEILTEIIVPGGVTHSANYEIREREVYDEPLVSAAVALTMAGSTVKSAKVVLGGVAPTPHEATAAEHALAGKTITTATAEAAGKAAAEGAQPLSQNAYKVTLVKTAVKRALLQAAKQKA